MELWIVDDNLNKQIVTVPVGLYSDNTQYIKSDFLTEFLPGGPVESVTIAVYEPTQFHAAIMLAHKIKQTWICRLNLYLPYFPGARQDRSNADGDILFAAKYYADIVNAVDFDAVVIIDPHSEVVPALLNQCVVIGVDDVYNRNPDVFDTYDGVIAPDAGAAKRAYALAQALEVPVKQAWKHRSTVDGSLTGFGSELLEEGHYLLVDDICDGGGTFIGLAQTFPTGVTADLYVTHGIFANGLQELNKYFNRIICTNSLNLYDPPTVIDIRSILA